MARGLTLATLGAAGLLVLLISQLGGSYALWTDTAPSDAGVVTTGSAELSAHWQEDQEGQAWSNLLPGESARRSFMLANTGSVPLEITATVRDIPAGFGIRITAETCSESLLTSAPADGTARPMTSSAQPDQPIELPAGDTTTGCVEVRVSETATPGRQFSFTAQIDGVQSQ